MWKFWGNGTKKCGKILMILKFLGKFSKKKLATMGVQVWISGKGLESGPLTQLGPEKTCILS